MEFIYDNNYPVRVSADGGSTYFAPGLVEEIFEAYEKYKSQKSSKPNVSLRQMLDRVWQLHRDIEEQNESTMDIYNSIKAFDILQDIVDRCDNHDAS